MILKYKEWEFNIETEGINTLVIENPKLFRRVLSDFNNQMSGWIGGFSIFENLEERDIAKEVFLINSPFSESINDKRIIKKLYAGIKNDILTCDYEKFREIESVILSFLDATLFNNSLDLEIEDSIEILDLLKISGVKFRESYHDTDILDRLIQHVIAIHQFLDPALIVFTNIKGMFSKTEWYDFVKDMTLRNINLLLIENRNFYEPNLGENVYTIDIDLCEIY